MIREWWNQSVWLWFPGWAFREGVGIVVAEAWGREEHIGSCKLWEYLFTCYLTRSSSRKTEPETRADMQIVYVGKWFHGTGLGLWEEVNREKGKTSGVIEDNWSSNLLEPLVEPKEYISELQREVFVTGSWLTWSRVAPWSINSLFPCWAGWEPGQFPQVSHVVDLRKPHFPDERLPLSWGKMVVAGKAGEIKGPRGHEAGDRSCPIYLPGHIFLCMHQTHFKR